MLSQFRKIIFKWKKKIVILILLSVAISFFVSLYLFSLNKHEVVVSDDGFKPVTLRINKGAVVSFKNETKRQIWPASDSHPSHDIYPEFDPKKPINPGESWDFIFDQEGRWIYHDHAESGHKGVVIVGSEYSIGTQNLRKRTLDECEKINSRVCWSDLLEYTLYVEGIEKAINLYVEVFNSNKVFAEGCHSYTHLLGDAAYKKFSAGEDFPVTDLVASCSYGFFHGFIEAMMREEGDLKRARDMCDYIDSKLRDKTYTLGACIHGIGHGVTDEAPIYAYGDEWKIISPGLKLCESIARSEREDKGCATGVFNSLAIMYGKKEYKLTLDKSDPFNICREQEKPWYKAACFDNFKALIMSIQGNNFLKAAEYVEGIDEDIFAKGAIDNLATYYVYFLLKTPDYKKPISECYTLQKRLHADCISGLGAGFMTAGTPGEEYRRALALCSDSSINFTDKDACHNRVVRLIRLRYSKEKYLEICKSVPSDFKKYCEIYINEK